MGLLKSAYSAVNKVRARYRGPTWDWPPGAITRASYDLRNRSLNGIPLGAPLDHLKPFGPAAWYMGHHFREFYYYRLGLIIQHTSDGFCGFEIVLGPTNHPSYDWHPFADGTRLALATATGKWVEITRATTEGELVSLLGAPIDGDPVADHPMNTFKASGHIIESIHDAQTGRLLVLTFSEAADDSESH